MLVQCWSSVVDGGPTLDQHWVDVSCCLLADPVRCLHQGGYKLCNLLVYTDLCCCVINISAACGSAGHALLIALWRQSPLPARCGRHSRGQPTLSRCGAWIEIFVSPEIINIEVIESDIHSKFRKILIIFQQHSRI